MALEKNLEMRKRAMTHLKDGGCVVVFPSGSVAASDRFGDLLLRESGTLYGEINSTI